MPVAATPTSAHYTFSPQGHLSHQRRPKVSRHHAPLFVLVHKDVPEKRRARLANFLGRLALPYGVSSFHKLGRQLQCAQQVLVCHHDDLSFRPRSLEISEGSPLWQLAGVLVDVPRSSFAEKIGSACARYEAEANLSYLQGPNPRGLPNLKLGAPQTWPLQRVPASKTQDVAQRLPVGACVSKCSPQQVVVPTLMHTSEQAGVCVRGPQQPRSLNLWN